jgi:glucose/arabinose dehydrogenase
VRATALGVAWHRTCNGLRAMSAPLLRAGRAVARTALSAIAGAIALCFAFPAAAESPAPGAELVAEEKGHSLRPRVVEPTDERVAGLKLPPGFRVTKFADGLGEPRMLRVGPDGAVYATRPGAGDVIALRDEDGDGRAEVRRTAVSDLDDVHDVAIQGDMLYLVTVRSVYRAPRSDASPQRREKLLDDLPDGGRHPNRTIAIGPDGALYVSVGSTCNCCIEPHPEAAAIVRAETDGSDRRLFATGLRNTIGFDWQPGTGAMWGMDHNTDWLGDDFPPEELNRLEADEHYGWPFLHWKGVFPDALTYPPGFDRAAYLAKSTSPVLGTVAHGAPMQMAFYRGTQFPEEYRDDAFVAMHGSWNRKPPTGFEVARIDFQGERPVAIVPFLTGFLTADGSATFGRPTGIAIAADGSLLVGDDETGVIYRVSYAP